MQTVAVCECVHEPASGFPEAPKTHRVAHAPFDKHCTQDVDLQDGVEDEVQLQLQRRIIRYHHFRELLVELGDSDCLLDVEDDVA